METLVPELTIATQNVDSLHARAGSKNVLELHGHLREARCTGCGQTLSLANGFDESQIEHGCGGRFRPQVVWFGEMLPLEVWARAESAAARSRNARRRHVGAGLSGGGSCHAKRSRVRRGDQSRCNGPQRSLQLRHPGGCCSRTAAYHALNAGASLARKTECR
jgi:hypothetical protein